MFETCRVVTGPAYAGPQQLPPGRHGLSRTFVEQNQRRRILAAVAARRRGSGYAEMTRRGHHRERRRLAADVLRALQEQARGVPRRLRRGRRAARAASRRRRRRRRGLRRSAPSAGLRALLHSSRREPAVAHMCVVEVMAAGPEALERRGVEHASVRGARRALRARAARRSRCRYLTAETIVGGSTRSCTRGCLRGDDRRAAGSCCPTSRTP